MIQEMKPPHELQSLSHFSLGERGVVYTVRSPVACERDEVLQQIGPVVSIDGVEYKVIGVERFAVRSPVHIGEAIGILVKPATKETP